jgi:Spy/CpxP family protein refolding chaperone
MNQQNNEIFLFKETDMNGQNSNIANRSKKYQKRAGAALAALLLIGGLLAVLPAVGLAGPFGGRGMMGGPPEERAAVLAYRLQLTDEQQEAFRAVMDENVERRQELREKFLEETAEAREQHWQEMKALDDDVEARLAEVLTEEQLAEFRQLREQRDRWREERQEGRRGGGGRPF